MAKLIFCFDGTCNSAQDWDDFFIDSSISNILKLHLLFGGQLNPRNAINEQIPQQHSFYYSGVGTRGSWFKRKLNALFAPSNGDIDEIINEAQSDLNKHFETGDEIFIFGFSRGAAIARMFAAHLPYPVKFIGVFDTVSAQTSSLDLDPQSYPSSDIVFENGSLGAHVEEALHLVSLDEQRVVFQPTLFNKDERVTEVWFAGAHSDIGGSYWYDGLADICLQFMIDNIANYLTVLLPTEVNYSNLKPAGAIDSICLDDLSIKPLYNGKLHHEHRTSINAMTLSPRLMRINLNDKATSEPAILHYSVIERFNAVSNYRPYSLRNTKFKVLHKNGQLGKEQIGIHSLNDNVVHI
ncbi:MAG: phospholipase effector Tle1 domain-containing protein [Colwellia sp.]